MLINYITINYHYKLELHFFGTCFPISCTTKANDFSANLRVLKKLLKEICAAWLNLHANPFYVNRLPFLFLLISCCTLSCNTFKIPDFVTFSNLRTESVGVMETTIVMDLVYYNPNRIGFQVKRTEADVYVDDVYLGRAISDTLIRVAKKSEFVIPVRKRIFFHTYIRL